MAAVVEGTDDGAVRNEICVWTESMESDSGSAELSAGDAVPGIMGSGVLFGSKFGLIVRTDDKDRERALEMFAPCAPVL